ncbi:Hypothetical predicted protein, partial [Paramuricea clavata]
MAHTVSIRPVPEFNTDATRWKTVASLHVGKTGSHTLTCFSWLVALRMNVGEGDKRCLFIFKESLNARVFDHISDRIITTSFKLANTKVVVVAVYFPSTNRSFNEYMKTLETLEQICLQYKNNKTNLILLGDFNAHIEENKVGQKWNKRGTKLQSMFNKLKLVPVNLYPPCDSQQLTYLSRTENSIIDYIILDKNLVQYMESVQVLNEHPDN